jgi:molecular chaperone GrpE
VTDAEHVTNAEHAMKDARDAGSGEHPEPAREQVVIRDKRKIDANGRPKAAAETAPSADAAGEESAATEPTPDVVDAEVVEVGTEPADGTDKTPAPLGAELEALRTELDERLRDLQRVGAEYANYRKRVERDRAVVGEQATGVVISALLPILDDIDRAREHDDLVGPFATVAEQLVAALAKFGLSGFGEVGDAFDPTRHEAVAHQTSAEVTEPTCVAVMRRGYLLGDRLLRAALVAVADPK